jgi:hypothetical protein
MKILTVAVAGTTLLTTVPAIAAADDPLQVIYKVSGVMDSGSADEVGIATVFFCTNFGNVAERVRISLRPEEGGVPINNTYDLGPRETKTFETHDTAAYDEDNTLAPGVIFTQSAAIILATTKNVHCSAAQVNAAAAKPIGIPLHMVRFNPPPNSQE